MAARRRTDKKRAGLADDAIAWLAGEPCGFFQFQSTDILEELWEAHGDTDSMFWRPEMSLPITLEDLEAFEDLWLASGEDDKYGGKSFFIYRYYSDDEKQELFESRGDKSLYRWLPGMRRPESI
jgi:hypothetical protein